jgi:peptidoglycan-N-acetylglucosamine deacetylase
VVSLGLIGLQAAPGQAATYSNARCGNTSGRVLLTFDDWAYGDPYRATRIGAYLRSHNLRAAFFLINKYAQSYPGIVSPLRQQATGCSTTPTPPRPHDPVGRIGELAVRHGISSNRLRPPDGAYNSRVANIASGLGYRICTWTIDTRDWQKPDGAHYRSTSSIRSIVRTAPRSAKASGVVLGHLFSNYPTAISGIIYDLHQQGLLLCRNRGPVAAWRRSRSPAPSRRSWGRRGRWPVG